MKGGRYGLFVGITPYDNYRMLPGAVFDAGMLAEAFTKQYGFVSRTVPTEPGTVDQPRPVGSDLLRGAVRDFGDEIARANLALIYVAAHGVSDSLRRSYIIYSSANPLTKGDAEELQQLFYPTDFLISCLNRCPNHRLLILDCCRTNPLQRGEEQPLVSAGAAVGRSLRNGIVVYSTQHDASAHEKQGRGYFAGVLAEEIRSGRHLKAISLFEAVQKRLEEKAPDDEQTRDFTARQSVAIDPGSGHGDILLADDSERYARARTDLISLAGNITSVSSSKSERKIAVATNQVWVSVKAHSEAAPAGRQRTGNPTLRFYRFEDGEWKNVGEALSKRKAYAIALTADGRMCFAGYEDGRITRWTLDEETTPVALHGTPKRAVNALVLSSDQSFVVTASCDRKARIHDAAGRSCLDVLRHNAEVWAADISADCRYVVTGTKKGGLLAWRVDAARQPVARLSFQPAGIRSLCFGNVTPLIAVGLTDGSVRIARLTGNPPVLEDTGIRHELKLHLFDPDDERIWNQAKHRKPGLQRLPGRSAAARSENAKQIQSATHVLTLAFDPDDRTLVAGTDLMGVFFVDVSSGRQFMPKGFTEKHFGRTTRVAALEFSTDGRTLFMGNGRQLNVLTFD
jgi:WD40 repeat protein